SDVVVNKTDAALQGYQIKAASEKGGVIRVVIEATGVGATAGGILDPSTKVIQQKQDKKISEASEDTSVALRELAAHGLKAGSIYTADVVMHQLLRELLDEQQVATSIHSPTFTTIQKNTANLG